ncbi:MAG: hypothetical protein IPP90_11485 [Gemmatimonadaceae bacterium]|nr:hypothetical protein [Gemmatimonadaceae bacterium]
MPMFQGRMREARAHSEAPRGRSLPRGRSGRIALVLLGLLVGAWAVYRPEVQRPFDFIDFPESILILKRHDSVLAQFSAFTSSYWREARFNPMMYLSVVLKWKMFGWWTPGWQLMRFATMSTIVLLAYALLRRLGISALGALGGATVFIIAPPAVRGWIRLSSAEPLATLLVLVATLMATRIQETRHRLGAVLSIAVLGALVVLTKEMLAVAFLLPIFVVLTVRPSGRLGAPRLSDGRLTTVGLAVLVLGASITPSIWAFVSAPKASYGKLFGSAAPSVLDGLGVALAALLPFVPTTGDVGVLLVGVAYAGLLLAGLPLALTASDERSHTTTLLSLAAILPLACGLAYLPWPHFQMVYALPFLFGEAAMVAVAISQLERLGRIAGVGACVAWCLVLTYAIPDALSSARRIQATQVVTGDLIARLANRQGVDSVLVVGPETVFDPRARFAPRLTMAASSQGLRIPTTVDVSCAVGAIAAGVRPNVLVVWSTLACGVPPMPGESIRRDFPRFDWRAFRWREASMRLDILAARSVKEE